MTFSDYFITGIYNIRRNRLRAVLTVVGVAVAIGALVSMLSFGIGLQTNIVNELRDNRNMKRIALMPSDSLPHLNDSILNNVSKIEHVSIAFPEITLPAKLDINNQTETILAKALPFSFPDFFDSDDFLEGGFFTSDTSTEIILFKSDLKKTYCKTDTLFDEEKFNHELKDLVGKEIELVTMTYDHKAMSLLFSIITMANSKRLPLKDSVTIVRIAGILDSQNQFGDFHIKAYIPFSFTKKLPSLGFERVRDLLQYDVPTGFEVVNVYVDEVENLSLVQEKLNKKGYRTQSILDNFKEIKRLFVIMDSILGAIGIMALFIAILGLVNTLVMSIYERTREIGIMKSLGARDAEIRALFIVEAGCIGFIGALAGIPLGWGITKIADLVFTKALFKEIDETIQLFSFPFYLLIGALAFAVIFSIVAGMYPANRASKVDPVKALRHD